MVPKVGIKCNREDKGEGYRTDGRAIVLQQITKSTCTHTHTNINPNTCAYEDTSHKRTKLTE